MFGCTAQVGNDWPTNRLLLVKGLMFTSPYTNNVWASLTDVNLNIILHRTNITATLNVMHESYLKAPDLTDIFQTFCFSKNFFLTPSNKPLSL